MSLTQPAHLRHWPPQAPRHLAVPCTNLWFNVEVCAARYPDKPFVLFYDSALSFAAFHDEAERLAGHLLQACGVRRGDRVLLCMQNSPQWMLACYAILRADAVVVPVNPMNRTQELRHCATDSGARTAFVAQDLVEHMAPLLGEALQHLVVATYSDHLHTPTDLPVPPAFAAPREVVHLPGAVAWQDALAADLRPGPLTCGPDDLCLMPYTSGTTGAPKGCMHTHRSVMATAVGGVQWFGSSSESVYLSVLPFFHVTGMTGGLNSPLFSGATVVLVPRWDRETAARCIARHRVTDWQVIATMMIDFLGDPDLHRHDLSSLRVVRGGGAAMPAAIAARLRDEYGLDYVEGYGLSETMAAVLLNPPQRPQAQCLGIPMFDVDARVVDPVTLAELPAGEVGEIIVHAPQVMQGYWQQPDATAAAFIQRDGKRFLRTGDLARVDDDGYFFMVDRLKRMINAAGYKVWPAEVESMMYAHPAIHEVCVIAARDKRRGETVKALIVLKEAYRGRVSEDEIARWAHEQMAAYKSPRQVAFVDRLPTSGSGKVLWRELQEREWAATVEHAAPADP